MAKDVNTEAVVTSTGVVEQPATAPDTSVGQVATDNVVQQDGDVTQTDAAATAEQQAEQAKGPVPYDRFKEVNDAKNTLETENQQLREHVNLLGAQPQGDKPQAEVKAPPSLTLEVMKSMGMDPDGMATNAEMAQVTDAVARIMAQQNSSQNNAQNFIVSNPDFAEVVGANDASGNFTPAPPLLRAFQKDPQLAADLRAAGTGGNRLAYKIAVADPIYQQQLADKAKTAPVVAGEVAEQAIKAAATMTSVSAAGTTGVIDKGAQFANMTDDQIKAHGEEIMRKGGVAV